MDTPFLNSIFRNFWDVSFSKYHSPKILIWRCKKYWQSNSCKVYADGKINNEIKIFNQEKYWNNDKSNCKILYFPDAKSYTFLCVNYDYNYLGTPISTGEKAFKIIFGNLFQSELGAKSSPIESKLKSLGFNSHLQITEKNTKFLLPKSEFGIDSLRIEF